jgi:N-acetylglucosaminyl-diphospho-decaprenol L-rhamnosyltransferase
MTATDRCSPERDGDGVSHAGGTSTSIHAPAVAIIIVNYKTYDELSACLDSLGASGSLFDVIVIDHESSPADLARVATRHPHARTVPTAGNPGFSAGVNAGARLASSPTLVFLNPDTRVQPQAIERMAAYLDEHPDVAVVGPRIEESDGAVQRSARRFPGAMTGLSGRSTWLTRLWPRNPLSRRDLLADGTTAAPVAVDWVAGSCMAVRAEAFHAAGGMDERFFLYWEDADLCKRLLEAGWRTVFLPTAVVLHAVGRSRRHARSLSIRAFHRSASLYFAKHRAGRFRAVSVPCVRVVLAIRMAVTLAMRTLLP